MSWIHVKKTGQPVAQCDSCGKFINSRRVEDLSGKVYKLLHSDVEIHDEDQRFSFMCRNCIRNR